MFMTKITKTLTAGTLALSLALTGMAPTQASAGLSEEDAVVGVLTLLLLGAAIHNSRDNDRVVSHPAPVRPARPQAARDWRILPLHCRQDFRQQNGNGIHLFSQSCLNNNYAHVNRLPQACHVRVRAANGQHRQGFRAACLRNAGFRTNQR